MRIAVVNCHGRRVGGLETYLSAIIPALTGAGHDIGFLHETDEPKTRDRIVSKNATSWSVAQLGAERSLAALREWGPDLIYSHKLESPELESEVIGIAPSVFFAHDYYGTCISGLKTFTFPTVRPCSRRFGWQCLLHYFPHRCGGRNPITMVRLYNLQSKRLNSLHRYDAIVTHSEHMLSEYLNHGLPAESAYRFAYYVRPLEIVAAEHQEFVSASSANYRSNSFAGIEAGFETNTRPNWRIVFSGRMEFLKGGHVFLNALPQVARLIDRPLQVIFIGDGKERRRLEAQAAHVKRETPNIQVEFKGWLSHPETERVIDESDLVVVPSLWPEPFGLVGPEAGQHGVPVAAFAVGGIPDWLKDGVNGHLAPGDPPTAVGLAAAIVACLRDPGHHAKLRSGAMVVSERFSLKNHLTALENVFQEVIKRRAAGAERSISKPS